MTDEMLQAIKSISFDDLAIGWKVQGKVSAQEQRAVHSRATLQYGQPVLQTCARLDPVRYFAIDERASLDVSTPLLTTASSQPHSNLHGISIARAIGQTAEDTREIADLLWSEMCVSGDLDGAESEAGVRVRISDDIDPSWAQSLLYNMDDKVSANRDVLVSRPIVSDTSGVLSLVLSHSALRTGVGEWTVHNGPVPLGHNGSRLRPLSSENKASTDIGFCTVEMKLLPPEHREFSKRRALHLLDPRRNSPVRKESVGVSFNIMSLYLHPSYRNRGLGRLMASLVKTFIAFIIDELVEQIAYRDYIRSAQFRDNIGLPPVSVSTPTTRSALDIAICGMSVDQRSDRVFRSILGGILSEYGGDRLSPANSDGSERETRLRSFALVCDEFISCSPRHRESELLAGLLRRLGEIHSLHPHLDRASPWGNVTTTTVDLVDWRADR